MFYNVDLLHYLDTKHFIAVQW